MKKNAAMAFLSLCIMVGFPALAITFGKGDAAMAICFLLFFAVDPAHSIYTGIFAGRCLRQRWYQPVLAALLFLVGVWTFFDNSELAFLLYAGCYLAMGLATMGLSFLFHKLLQKMQSV